jgi:hypothetical protein
MSSYTLPTCATPGRRGRRSSTALSKVAAVANLFPGDDEIGMHPVVVDLPEPEHTGKASPKSLWRWTATRSTPPYGRW